MAGYKIEPLTPREYTTLLWLSSHGYDAGILNMAGVDRVKDGTITLGEIPEHMAWDINKTFFADPDAFLSCCGSKTLADKLYNFLNSIV